MENIIYEKACNLVADNDIKKISKTRADRLYGSMYTLLIISIRMNLECMGEIHDMFIHIVDEYDKRFSRSRCTK